MKKFILCALFGLLFMAFAPTASAQYVVRNAKDSTAGVATKYANFLNTKKGATGFQLTVVKDTGTVGGTVILERRIDTLPTSATSVWRQVGSQSYTLLNQTGPQGDIFPITVQDGVSYRFKITTTGGKIYLYASYLRW